MVTLLCGGNIDTTVLGRCLERGLAADGRLVKFSVTVSDRPGGIAELAKTLTQCGVSIKDMMHERAWIKSDIFAVTVSHYKRYFILGFTGTPSHALVIRIVWDTWDVSFPGCPSSTQGAFLVISDAYAFATQRFCD